MADGAADLGITGRDLVVECARDVQVLLDLGFGRCRLCVAAREESELRTVEDVAHGTRVATTFPRATREFFERAGYQVARSEAFTTGRFPEPLRIKTVRLGCA